MQLNQSKKFWGEQPGPKAPQRVEAEYCKSPVVFRSTPQEWCKSPPSPNRWMTMLRLSRVRRGVRSLARPWVRPGQRTGSHARLNPCLAHPMQGGTKDRHPATSPCLSRRPPAKRAASTRSLALASHAQRRDRWPGLLRRKSRPGQGGYQVAGSTRMPSCRRNPRHAQSEASRTTLDPTAKPGRILGPLAVRHGSGLGCHCRGSG